MVFQRKHRLDVFSVRREITAHHIDPLKGGGQVLVPHRAFSLLRQGLGSRIGRYRSKAGAFGPAPLSVLR
jgi:hypothetical protein